MRATEEVPKGRVKKLRKALERGEVWSRAKLIECRIAGLLPSPCVQMVPPPEVLGARVARLRDVAQILWRALGPLCGGDVYCEPNTMRDAEDEWPPWLRVGNGAAVGRVVLCFGEEDEEETDDGVRIKIFDPKHAPEKLRAASDFLSVTHGRPPWVDSPGKREDDDDDVKRKETKKKPTIDDMLLTFEDLTANQFPTCSSSPPVLDDLETTTREEEDDDDDVGVAVASSLTPVPPPRAAARIVAACCVSQSNHSIPAATPSKNDLESDEKAKLGEERECFVQTASRGRERKIFALDCEMVQSSRGTELARCTLVDATGTVILDTLVKPARPVVDYCTRWSGVDARSLRDVKTTLTQAQAALLLLVSAEDLLIGHSLDNDLRALKVVHLKCADTSLLYVCPRGPGFRRSLRDLTCEYLERDIQQGAHDSAEDARAALDLFHLKLSRGLDFGGGDASKVRHRQKTMLQHCSDLFFEDGKVACRCAVVASDATFVKKMAKGNVSAIACARPDLTKHLAKHLAAGWHVLVTKLDDFKAQIAALRLTLPPDALLLAVKQPSLARLYALDAQKRACNDVRAAANWTPALETERQAQLARVAIGRAFVFSTVTFSEHQEPKTKKAKQRK